MGELERWGDYELVVPSKQTRKKLDHIEQQAIVKRAAREAALQDAARNLEASEQLSLLRSRCRVAGTYDLADYASLRATFLNRSISQQSRDNPGLEMIHRGFEETAATVSALIIYNYGMGR